MPKGPQVNNSDGIFEMQDGPTYDHRHLTLDIVQHVVISTPVDLD